MSIIKPTRRGLITGLASLIAAPALVKASSLMPVKAWVEPVSYDSLHFRTITWVGGTNDLNGAPALAQHMAAYHQALAQAVDDRRILSFSIMQPFMRVGPNDTVHVQADISLTPFTD